MFDKYLWIGGFFNPAQENELIKNGHTIMSSYKSQKNLLEGIEYSGGIVFDSINSVRLNGFPKYKKLLIKKDSWSHRPGASDRSVSYWNIQYLSVFFRSIQLKREARRWAKPNNDKKVVAFCFGMTTPFMKAAVELKKRLKDCKLVLINPDLPQFMEKNPGRLKRILKRIDRKWIDKHYLFFDKHIVYSSHMAEYLGLAEGSWITVEGSISIQDVKTRQKTAHENTVVLYCGAVGKMYHVDNLVNAFSYLGNDFELRVFGTGDYSMELSEISKKDARIKYYGYCSDRERLLQEETDADILVSLINPEEDISNYCFPSKIFEYMLSGNVVLSTKIGGIPDEYFEYIVPLESVSAKSIADALRRIKGYDPSALKAVKKGEVSFIVEQKNNIVQGKKILEFINNCYE